MNKKQYNNVIEHTLKHEQSAQTDDALATARAIFDNMGVALPQGDIKTVCKTIKTNNYMGWKSCTMQEAQVAANKGTAAIGINEDKIIVLSANDEEQPVTETASVMTLTENTTAFAVEGLQYYAYSCGGTGSTTTTIPINYCGGFNYRDVTQHTMVLQDDGYYVCCRCGYRVKSPALQDKDVLSDEDYYKVLSCYLSIPYYSKIDRENEDNYSIRATALRLIIDDIRSKSQYSRMYEYVGSDGLYKREYTVGDENDSYYMPTTINYNIIDNGLELILNNGAASGIVELLVGWAIPTQYQFLFLDLTDGYTNLTDFLCELAEKVGYKEIGIILKLILFGSSINEMAVTDKVVRIQFSVGSGVYETKTVFDSCGNLKFQEHSTY